MLTNSDSLVLMMDEEEAVELLLELDKAIPLVIAKYTSLSWDRKVSPLVDLQLKLREFTKSKK